MLDLGMSLDCVGLLMVVNWLMMHLLLMGWLVVNFLLGVSLLGLRLLRMGILLVLGMLRMGLDMLSSAWLNRLRWRRWIFLNIERMALGSFWFNLSRWRISHILWIRIRIGILWV